jgi:glycogen debranching enzyme
MDKMGSAGVNRGYPATSRDGAPIEMTALLKSSLDLVSRLNREGKYPYEGVFVNG